MGINCFIIPYIYIKLKTIVMEYNFTYICCLYSTHIVK